MDFYCHINNLHLAIPHACNHSCTFLSQGEERDKRLGAETIFDLLDRLKNLKTCTLSGGEALLWPDDIDLLLDRLLSEHPKLLLSLITNGSLFKERHFSIVSQGRFRKIDISFNASDDAAYTSLHGRKHFQKVLKNIQRLSEIRTDLTAAGKPLPVIQVSCVLSRATASNIEGYCELLGGKVDDIVLQELGYSSPTDDLNQSNQITPELWNEMCPSILRLSDNLKAKGTHLRVLTRHPLPFTHEAVAAQSSIKTVSCKQALTELMVKMSGEITIGCCNSQHQLGVLGKESLDEIAAKPVSRRLAANIHRGNFEFCSIPRLRHNCPSAVAMDTSRKLDRAVLMVFTKPLWPIEHGNQQRAYNVLKWLKKEGYRTILAMPGNKSTPREPVHVGATPIVDELVIVDPADWQDAAWDDRWLHERDVVAEEALTLFKDYIWCFTAMRSAVNDICRRITPVAVIANYMFMAPVFQAVPDRTLRIIDTHDMFSRQVEQVVAQGVEAPLACSPEVERKALLAADVIIAIQANEQKLFSKLVPEREVITVGIAEDEPVKATDRVNEGTVLFIGSSNMPNKNGIRHFLDNVWPLVLERLPHVKLLIAGRICDLLKEVYQGVELLGYREDMTEVYAKVAVVVNVTRVGTGLKVKSVEAICNSKPLVAWPVGLEGLPDDERLPFVEANSEQTFAEAVVKILKDSDCRRELAGYANDYARKHFASSVVFGKLQDALENVLKKSLVQ